MPWEIKRDFHVRENKHYIFITNELLLLFGQVIFNSTCTHVLLGFVWEWGGVGGGGGRLLKILLIFMLKCFYFVLIWMCHENQSMYLQALCSQTLMFLNPDKMCTHTHIRILFFISLFQHFNLRVSQIINGQVKIHVVHHGHAHAHAHAHAHTHAHAHAHAQRTTQYHNGMWRLISRYFYFWWVPGCVGVSIVQSIYCLVRKNIFLFVFYFSYKTHDATTLLMITEKHITEWFQKLLFFFQHLVRYSS